MPEMLRNVLVSLCVRVCVCGCESVETTGRYKLTRLEFGFLEARAVQVEGWVNNLIRERDVREQQSKVWHRS